MSLTSVHRRLLHVVVFASAFSICRTPLKVNRRRIGEAASKAGSGDGNRAGDRAPCVEPVP